jgi:hypothetical protein
MKRYQRARRYRAILRAAGIFAASLTVISGVAYAALSSAQAKLSPNTISTASADLQISLDNANFGASKTGFNFANLVPGGTPVPGAGDTFYLKNTGTSAEALKFSVSSVPTNPGNVNLNKVQVYLALGTGSYQIFSLQSLIDANAGGGLAITTPSSLGVGSSAQFNMKVAMDADAVSGASATIGGIDFAFSGIPQ